MTRLALSLAVAGLIGICYWQMRKGWMNQARSQSQISAPHPIGTSTLRFQGIYASTTFANQPLKRIVAHGLGARTSVEVGFDSAQIDIYRSGSTSFSIPRSDIVAISRASGIAGKFVGDRSLTLLTWRLGGIEVDTGLLVGEDLVNELAKDNAS